jgi:hypothetical protein
MEKSSTDDQLMNLEVLHPNAAGIDIGNAAHYVAVPPDRDSEPVRRFACFTQDVRAIADWLKQCGIVTVAMQSTGVYWLPVYELLVERGFEVFLVNARHTKNLPGRKSDVQECQWLMKLHTYGLLNNSFRPTEEICVLRTYWRQRDEHVKAASAVIQRMQKVLTEMNVQIANVISDISGVTGMAILDAILTGERDATSWPTWLIRASRPARKRSPGVWKATGGPSCYLFCGSNGTSTTSIKSASANAMKLSSCICAPWRTKRNRKISRRIPNGASGRVATPRGSICVVSCIASRAWI